MTLNKIAINVAYSGLRLKTESFTYIHFFEAGGGKVCKCECLELGSF